MKRIRKLSHPTPGLDTYLAEKGNNTKDWEEFRSHKAGASYRELAETLMDIQHGLCGYCETDIDKRDRQVEHVVPQSDPQQGAARALDHANMIACCKGGTFHTDDDERWREPVRHNRSCGEAKGNSTDAGFIDPRTLPALPSLTRVHPNGNIEADTDACKKHGIAAVRVKRTIKILRLNVERLRLAREKRWNALSDNWKADFDNPQVMESCGAR